MLLFQPESHPYLPQTRPTSNQFGRVWCSGVDLASAITAPGNELDMNYSMLLSIPDGAGYLAPPEETCWSIWKPVRHGRLPGDTAGTTATKCARYRSSIAQISSTIAAVLFGRKKPGQTSLRQHPPRLRPKFATYGRCPAFLCWIPVLYTRREYRPIFALWGAVFAFRAQLLTAGKKCSWIGGDLPLFFTAECLPPISD